MSQSPEAQAAAEAATKEAAEKAAADATKVAEEAAVAAKEKAEKEVADALASLPKEFEWVGKEITNLRRENGGYRTKLREQTEKFKGAVSAEDFEAAVAKVREDAEELVLKDALREYDLPDELAPLIQGGTPEETYARAAALKAVVGAPGAQKILDVKQLHSGHGPQGGGPKPVSGRETYRQRHKRN